MVVETCDCFLSLITSTLLQYHQMRVHIVMQVCILPFEIKQRETRRTTYPQTGQLFDVGHQSTLQHIVYTFGQQ